MVTKNFLGIVIVAIAVPVLIKIICWIYSGFMLIRLSFMTIEQQESYYEKKYECFAKDTREYPEQLLQSLKDDCERWKKCWLQNVEKDENETEQEYQELLDFQKERIEFWDNAVKSINTEIWYRGIRNSNT